MSGLRETPRAWALVPMKRMEFGKSRLSAVLSRADRILLQTAMLRDVIVSLSRGPMLAGVAVVSLDPEAGRIARTHGAEFIREPERACGISQAVAAGTDTLRQMGAGLIAVVPADVPLIDAGDVEQGLAAARQNSATVVAPDRRMSGTNGLFFAADAPPQFAFGSDSFRKHLEQPAVRPALPLRLRSLELDVDEPQDLQVLRGRASSAHDLATDLATLAVLDKLMRVGARDAALSEGT